MYNENTERIKKVYDALGNFKDEVIFLGGATVSFYTDRETTEQRPTMDVDILIELSSRREYAEFEEELRKRGFVNDQASGILCRFLFEDVTVDVMPTEEAILGFSNRWYIEGFNNSIDYEIEAGYTIQILSLPYFIACKMEAFKGRGKGDGRTSHDFEDLIFIFNNRSTIWDDMKEVPPAIRKYLIEEISELLENPHLEEWIAAHLDFHERSRSKNIMDGFNDFVSLPSF